MRTIADALNLKIERLLNAPDDSVVFNPKTYSKILLAIDTVLLSYKLQTNQHTIEKIAKLTYKHYEDIQNLEEVIKGMVLVLDNITTDLKKLN